MRNVYLIRHGHPDFPIGSRICLGQTDTPLGTLGHLQGVLLKHTFSDKTLAGVYTSPLHRAYDTARYLNAPLIIKSGLTERATGLWDGLSFDEIAQRWPKTYTQRGENPSLNIPGAEKQADACARFTDAFTEILRSTKGNIAIVAHKGVINAFVQTISQQDRLPQLPYGAYWQLTLENDTLTFNTPVPIKPQPELDRALCLDLLQTAAPKQVIHHSEAVETLALEIAAQLPLALNTTLIMQAALLHDIARALPDHANLGAQWLTWLGYPDVADIVRQHHDLDTTQINEASIVYIADKSVHGTCRCSVSERFAKSKNKCQNREALAAWGKRWHMTETLQKNINALCGKEIIQ